MRTVHTYVHQPILIRHTYVYVCTCTKSYERTNFVVSRVADAMRHLCLHIPRSSVHVWMSFLIDCRPPVLLAPFVFLVQPIRIFRAT